MAEALTLRLVEDETVRPSPTEYAPLLPTLQTTVGMVLNDGRPKVRDARKLDPSRASTDVNARAARLWARCKAFASRQVTTGPIWKGTSTPLGTKTQLNFQACAQPVTKDELINYIRHAKRLDTEQAAAMAIAYIDRALPHNGDLTDQSEIDEDFEMVEDDDSFEKRPDDRNATLLDDLINDPSIGSMLTDTYMWRADSDYELVENSRDAGKARKLRKVQKLLAESSNEQTGQVTITRTTLQTIRRRRPKLDNFQRLAIPEEYLPDRNVEPKVHENWTHFYGHNQTPLPNGETSTPTVIPKRKFRKIQRLLYHLNGAQDETSVYIRSVDTLIRSAGLLNPQRIAALERSQDPAAIAYSFIAAQRRRQLTVVSDHQWSRFLVKGEGKLILQNRPDVLTSFEDCLVRASTDLVALSAVACPKGVRDHFSNADDVKDRTKRVCEKMEEYVRIFGGGKTENLVFRKEIRGGSGRGPVDVYNALCDELRDCRTRARALGFELGIGPCHKFLAKDIMAWNEGWKDDAFAEGKVPGWVEYLARVRLEDMAVEYNKARETVGKQKA